jgi:hypothetical protein
MNARGPDHAGAPRTEARLRQAGSLVAGGLVIEAVSLLWHHPLSFVLFAATTPLLVLGGIAVYLLSLTRLEERRDG